MPHNTDARRETCQANADEQPRNTLRGALRKAPAPCSAELIYTYRSGHTPENTARTARSLTVASDCTRAMPDRQHHKNARSLRLADRIRDTSRNLLHTVATPENDGRTASSGNLRRLRDLQVSRVAPPIPSRVASGNPDHKASHNDAVRLGEYASCRLACAGQAMATASHATVFATGARRHALVTKKQSEGISWKSV